MQGIFTYLIVGIALVLAVEGFFYALFTDRVRALLNKLQDVPDSKLRSGGLMALVLGVGILWFMRQ